MKIILILSFISLVLSQISPDSEFRINFPYYVRIAGGMDAQPNLAPYIVSIQAKGKDGNFLHICGGTILNENWIITAAHCIPTPGVEKNMIIKAGRHNIQQKESTSQERSIDYYKQHELYLGGVMPYDIVLIYTKNPFTWTNAVKKIDLPKKGDIPRGKAKLFGWGNISTTNKPVYPDILQAAIVPVIDYSECQRALGGPTGSVLHDTNLCTGPLTGGISACNADSGGPLIQTNSNGKDVLIGVVSWGGTPCGKSNSPSVYVRVSEFIQWIAKVQSDYKT